MIACNADGVFCKFANLWNTPVFVELKVHVLLDSPYAVLVKTFMRAACCRNSGPSVIGGSFLISLLFEHARRINVPDLA